jgi:hypothetical protein
MLVCIPWASQTSLAEDAISRAGLDELVSVSSEEVSCVQRGWADAVRMPALLDFVLFAFAVGVAGVSVVDPPDIELPAVIAVALISGWRWWRTIPSLGFVVDDVIASPAGVRLERWFVSKRFPYAQSSIIMVELGPWWLIQVERRDGASARRLVDGLGVLMIARSRRAWAARHESSPSGNHERSTKAFSA